MNQNRTMKTLPNEERPYEKCLSLGSEALTDTELLAAILRTGTAGRTAVELAGDVLSLCPFVRGLSGIYHLTVEQLMELRGVGLAKAVQIKCIGELSTRIARERAHGQPRISDAAAVADYYMETLRHEEREHLFCMMLDAGNHLLGDVRISTGTVNASLLSPREIFLSALRYHAVHVILVHNHPSGDCTPSEEDKRATERVQKAGELLGIRLLDHIIIGDRCWHSLLETGGQRDKEKGPVTHAASTQLWNRHGRGQRPDI